MARVTFVKKAQQRYETVPVLDADGNQVQVPVLRKDGTPKMTRSKPNRPGRPILMKLTRSDKSNPKPLLCCDFCKKDIEIGTPYKHITPKSGPYGGRQRNRHHACPNWNVWEYSSSLSARIAQIIDGFDISGCDSPDEVTEMLSGVADEVRNLGEEKREGASNIEEGFGHPTSASEELESIADQLDGWADEIEGVDVPELPEPEEVDCESCDGVGEVACTEGDREDNGLLAERKPCEDCEGTGQVTPDEPTEEQMEQWQADVENACSIVEECPV